MLQQSLVSLSMMMMQGLVNSFGKVLVLSLIHILSGLEWEAQQNRARLASSSNIPAKTSR